MRLTTLPPAVLDVVLNACETEPVLLNSERIQRRFGSYDIRVLPSEPGLRRSSLYSIDDDGPVCRTYAVVRFADQPHDGYSEEHAKVLAGNSIGAIFRSHGWDIHKQTSYIGRLLPPVRSTQIGQLMQISDRRKLALHVYQLLLARNDQVFEYATIVETHHPEYLSESDVLELYEYDESTGLSPVAVSDLARLVFHVAK